MPKNDTSNIYPFFKKTPNTAEPKIVILKFVAKNNLMTFLGKISNKIFPFPKTDPFFQNRQNSGGSILAAVYQNEL